MPRRRSGICLLVLLALLCAPLSAAPAISLAEYVGRLEHIDGLLAANQTAAASAEARDLLGAEISWARGTFRSDDALLAAIGEAETGGGRHRTRLLDTVAELRRAGGMESAAGDRKLLAQIAAEQEVAELPRGGTLPTTFQKDVPLLERIAVSAGEMLEWLRDRLADILRWLLDFFRLRGDGGASSSIRWIVFGVVALIVVLMIMLTVTVIRRSGSRELVTVESSAPLGSTRDDDPLSRGATEWERYAAELAASGQYREAIRAWYHAVLVTCYAAGILHFRRGRTNWEYVASLSPALAWRPLMIALTRRFEHEWYGAERSTLEDFEECRTAAQSILDALRREMRGAA